MEGPRERSGPSADSQDQGARWTFRTVGDKSWLRRRVHELTILEFRLARILALTAGVAMVVGGSGVVFGPQARRVALGLSVALFGTALVFVTNAVVGFGCGWVSGQYFAPAAAHFFEAPWLARPPFETLIVFLSAVGGAYTLNRLFVFVFALPFGLTGLSLWGKVTDAIGFAVFPASLPTLGRDPVGFLLWFPLAFLQVFLGLGSLVLFTAGGMAVGGAVLTWSLPVMTAAAGANLVVNPTYPAEVGRSVGLLDIEALVELNALWDLLARVFAPSSLAALGLCLVGVLGQLAVMPYLVREDAGWTFERVE